MTDLLSIPPRRPIQFMLTPLVDVMFLLLIFFMLSSETSLYTLLRLTSQTVAGSNTAPAAAQPELVLSIGRDSIRVNGVVTPADQLSEVLARFRASGIGSAVLVPSSGALVQDIVTVLETFEAAAFAQVRLISAAAP